MTYEEPKGGWDSYDIFDVQLIVRTVRAKDDGPSRLSIDGWEIKEADTRLFALEHQGRGEEDGKRSVEWHQKPFDMEQVHVKEPPAVQAKVLDLPNIFSPTAATGGRTARRYNRSSETSEE